MMKPNLRKYIGKPIRVVIDRPLGSRHPRHPDIINPVNYGYIPDTVSGDGMEIDAYLLGVDEPVTETEGVVIAVVVRDNDIEDKLVVAPPGLRFSTAEVGAQVAFQEQFFDSHIVMNEEDADGNR